MKLVWNGELVLCKLGYVAVVVGMKVTEEKSVCDCGALFRWWVVNLMLQHLSDKCPTRLNQRVSKIYTSSMVYTSNSIYQIAFTLFSIAAMTNIIQKWSYCVLVAIANGTKNFLNVYLLPWQVDHERGSLEYLLSW